MAHKLIVTAKFPGNTKKFIVYANNVVTCLTGNTYFPSPPVTLAALQALIPPLVAADESVDKRTLGAKAARTALRSKVEKALRLCEAYVTSIVQEASLEDGAQMLATSGFQAKDDSVHAKAAYAVKKGPDNGSANVTVKALGRHGTVMYCHQYSLDAGKTWVDVPPTVDVAITLPALPLGQPVVLRFRTLIKGLYGDWSQMLNYLVH
jgi:hypothetical protein